ncbi:hypothetical protein Hanom_Chr14g01265311 [Helianthus anomalus]
MIYVVIEDGLGLNVHAGYDEIGIQRAEAQRMERQQRDAQEAADAAKGKGKGIVDEEVLESSSQKEQQSSNVDVNTEMAIVLAQQFLLVGSLEDVPYNKAEIKRQKEVKHRKAKKDGAKDDKLGEDEEDDNTEV